MDKIVFNCPHCSKTMSVPPNKAGRRGKCTGCSEVITVPEHFDSPVSEVEPEICTGEDDVFGALGDEPLSTGESLPPKKKRKRRKKSHSAGNVSVSLIPPEVIREEGDRFPAIAERLQECIAGHLRTSPEIYSDGELCLTFLKYSLVMTSVDSETAIGVEVRGNISGKQVAKIFRYENKTSRQSLRTARKIMSPIRGAAIDHFEDQSTLGSFRAWRVNQTLDSRIQRAIDTIAIEILSFLKKSVGQTTPNAQRWNVTWFAGMFVATLIFLLSYSYLIQSNRGKSSTLLLAAQLIVFGPPSFIAGHCLSAAAMPDDFFRYEKGGIRLRTFTRSESPKTSRWILVIVGLAAAAITIGIPMLLG